MDNIQLYNTNTNTSLDLKKLNKENKIIRQSVPLSRILSNHLINNNYFDFENFENTKQINEENNQINNDNQLYNYKEVFNNYKKKRKEEQKKRKYEIEKEKEYKNNLKLLYEKSNKQKINFLINQNKKPNSFSYYKEKEDSNQNEIELKQEKVNIIENKEEKKEDNKQNEELNNNINNINNNKEIKKEKEIDNKEKEIDKIIAINNKNKDNNIINDTIYEVELSLRNLENKEIHNKKITIDKSTNYLLNLDYIFSISSSILNLKKIEYKYGLSYKLGYLYLQEKIGSINLLNYDILSTPYNTKENIIKKLKMEINIIKGDLTLQKNLSSNPQLFCKLSKNYKIIPELKTINDYNLFSYDQGLKIDMKYLSIIFTKNKIYDLTFINFDEFAYNDDTEIFFDNKNFDKENSSLKKLNEEEITLIYKGINNLYEIKYKEIIVDYLKKRYKNKKYEINEEYNVVINTQIKNLLISEEQSKLYYDEFKTNLKDI